MDSKSFFVQEFKGAIITGSDQVLGLILGTVIDTMDIIVGRGDLLESFRCKVTRKWFATSGTVDGEGKGFD